MAVLIQLLNMIHYLLSKKKVKTISRMGLFIEYQKSVKLYVQSALLFFIEAKTDQDHKKKI